MPNVALTGKRRDERESTGTARLHLSGSVNPEIISTNHAVGGPSM